MRGANNMVPCREGVISEKTFLTSNGGFFPEVNRNTWGSSKKKTHLGRRSWKYFQTCTKYTGLKYAILKKSEFSECSMLHDQFISLPLPPTIMKVKLVSARRISSISAPFAVAKPNILGSKQSSSAKISASAGRNEIFQNHRLIVFSRLFRYILFTQYWPAYFKMLESQWHNWFRFVSKLFQSGNFTLVLAGLKIE